jgi:serine/threonine protein phosphatase PrpC
LTIDRQRAIASRNDTERRQGRQRMGTTLVMALAHIHELYVAHVGDSRAYLITTFAVARLVELHHRQSSRV